MTFREGTVAGMPTRDRRVSFSGELAYELNVAGWHGLAMWEAVMAAGEPFGMTPYGTEAMHVLRAEKGFPIIGQDTDGTVTPHDLGMSWIVRKDDSDFLGKRSFRRVDTIAARSQAARRPAAGSIPHALIPEGAQLVVEDTGRIPMPMVGHVTSSYRSAILGPDVRARDGRGRPRDARRDRVRAAPRGNDRRDGHRARLLRPGGSAP